VASWNIIWWFKTQQTIVGKKGSKNKSAAAMEGK
jgi:hypothetical protein